MSTPSRFLCIKALSVEGCSNVCCTSEHPTDKAAANAEYCIKNTPLICSVFADNKCRKGNNCTCLHVHTTGLRTLCPAVLQPGGCQVAGCRALHPRSCAAAAAEFDRKKTLVPCPAFARAGTCRAGDECSRLHLAFPPAAPMPTITEAAEDVPELMRELPPATDMFAMRDTPPGTPTRFSTVLCKHALSKRCTNAACTFAHPADATAARTDSLRAAAIAGKTQLIVCRANGSCSAGDACRFVHCTLA